VRKAASAARVSGPFRGWEYRSVLGLGAELLLHRGLPRKTRTPHSLGSLAQGCTSHEVEQVWSRGQWEPPPPIIIETVFSAGLAETRQTVLLLICGNRF